MTKMNPIQGSQGISTDVTTTKMYQVSPTGTPVIPPKFIPWIAIIVSLVAGVNVTLMAMTPPGGSTLVTSVLGVFLTVGSAVLGIISPGWRTPPPAGQFPP